MLVILFLAQFMDLFLIFLGISVILVFIAYYSYSYIKNKWGDKSRSHKQIPINKTNNLYSEFLLSSILTLSKFYFVTVNELINGDEKKLDQIKKNYKLFTSQNKEQLNQIQSVVKKQKNIFHETEQEINQIPNAIDQAIKGLKTIIRITLKNCDNDLLLTDIQKHDLNQISEYFSQYLNFIIQYLKSSKEVMKTDLDYKFVETSNSIEKVRDKTLKQLKKQKITVKSSVVILSVLSETDNILMYIRKTI